MAEGQQIFSLIAEGDTEGLAALLEADPSQATARSPEGISALMTALYHGRPEMAALLKARVADPDIFEAAALGDLDGVSRMLDADPALAQQWSPDGFTALHLAAFFGHASLVPILLRAGSDANAVARNPMKVAPIHSAAASRNAEAVEMLLEFGADPNAAQEGGITALHAAAHHGEVEMVEVLLDRGARPDVENAKGETPLALATAGGHPDVVRLLSKPA